MMFDLNEDPMKEMYEENQELKEKIQDLEKLITDKNKEVEKVKKEMSEMRGEHCCELEDLTEKVWVFFDSERERNLRILEARRKIVQWMKSYGIRGERFSIRLKKIGELKKQPFVQACKKRFKISKAAELWLTWQENLKDPAWYPFKRVRTGDYIKEVVDEEDEKLKNLREEWGEEVMDAVKTGLEEIKEFNNPNGRNFFDELWDFKRYGKVTLAPGIFQLAMQQIRPPLHMHDRISAGLKSHYERVQISERKRSKIV